MSIISALKSFNGVCCFIQGGSPFSILSFVSSFPCVFHSAEQEASEPGEKVTRKIGEFAVPFYLLIPDVSSSHLVSRC